MQPELLVFDLDGTMIDSKLDLALSVNAARADLNLPPLGDNIVFSYVGNGAPVLIRKAIGEQYGEAQLQRSLEFFLNYYRQHMLDNTRLYPGAAEALQRLQAAGVRMAVLTNKPVRFSRELLRGLGVLDRFQLVYGGNSFETKKPHPEGLSQAMAELGVPPEQTMVVGDSAVDVRTARNAGAWACGVTYGFQPETFAEEPPDLLVDSLPQLADLLLEARRNGGAMSLPSSSGQNSATPPQPG
jgi:phosphoglycolate phosphatase